MRLLILPLGLAAMLFVSAAGAQECDRNDESQSGMNVCADMDYKQADAALNKTYGQVVARLSEEPEAKKRLQAAQRAWIGFRDGECAFDTVASEEGSVYPMVLAMCLQGLTDERTKQLGGYLECEEGDMSCPVPAE